jgi:hypothetical protein
MEQPPIFFALVSYYTIHASIAKYGIDIQIVRPEMTKFKMFRELSKHEFLFCSFTRKGYNGMPLHVMEQPPRFFALAYRVSDTCIYQ